MRIDRPRGAADGRALGTYAELTVQPVEAIADAVAIVVPLWRRLDRCASRFRPDSDLSRVNRAAGSWVRVDPLLVDAVEVAVGAADHSDGLVHPLLGTTMVALGYSRSFETLPGHGLVAARTSVVRDSWRAIELDPDGAIRIPEGTALDLGSSGKAFGADLAADALSALDGAIVSLGGDIAIAGASGAWPVRITERDEGEDEVVFLAGGGLATSSTRRRRWTASGTTMHHLVDPRTGGPAAEVWRTVSATGPSAAAANVAATAAVILGAEAPGWLAARGVAARLVSRDGVVTRVGAWPAPELVDSRKGRS